MPRDLPLGNGAMLVNFDAHYHLRDLYFPHVGQENHTLGSLSRLGLWVDGQFTWLSDWPLQLRYGADTLVTDVTGTHQGLGLSFAAADAVDYRANVLVRRFVLTDQLGRERRVRLFVHFNPHISESAFANCAYFDAARQAVICYKGDRYFLLASQPALGQYAVGTKGTDRFQGTWRDAEDGALSNNAVASGYVDATLMFELTVPAHGSATGYSWLAAGTALDEVTHLHEQTQTAPALLLERTAHYWRFWLRRARQEFGDLSPAAADLYRRSLLVVRTQIDNNGAIIAANDSDIAAFGADHYSYVWPRDAALVAETLDSAGFNELPRQFYGFLRKLLNQANYATTGYLLHRYTPTGLVAASWHPSVGESGAQLPIQEDETALVVYSLCRHLQATGNSELLRDLFDDFLRQAAEFLMLYRDPLTGLPRPSYDLWEERFGVSLFTCSTVAAALREVAALVDALGQPRQAEDYRVAAEEIRQGVAEHFYDPELGRFVDVLLVQADDTYRRDPLLDSSMAGVFVFDLFPADDPRVVRTMQALRDGLENAPPFGGLARRALDYYQHVSGNYAEYQGNSWFVSTLWLADWYSATGQRAEARRWIEWSVARALPSGILAEQLHPRTGAPLSVSPLTWSHAAYIASVNRYLESCAGAVDQQPAGATVALGDLSKQGLEEPVAFPFPSRGGGRGEGTA